MIVTTRYGALEGRENEWAEIFLGVPFAAPPVGDKRFRKPFPVESWEGIREAGTVPPMAVQRPHEPGTFYFKEFYDTELPEQSEDCLYLNIWTPRQSADKQADSKQTAEKQVDGKQSAGSEAKEEGPYPVAIWYHGGAFQGGFISELPFDGTGYAKRGVILVEAAYRLGTLGYLVHPEFKQRYGVNGNLGLYDQIAALDWVYDNIASFGGDPTRITIFGQSAGGMSVRCLLASPLTKGKIAGAIIMSGGGYQGVLDVGYQQEKSGNLTRDFLESRGITLEDLGAMEASEVIRQTSYLGTYGALHGGGLLFVQPVIDGEALTMSADQAVEAGLLPDIPYMIGATSDDIGKSAKVSGTVSYAEAQERQEETDLVPTVNWKFLRRNQMVEAADNFAEALTQQGKKVFTYFFQRQMPGDEAGAFHSAELWYVFGTTERCWRPLTEADRNLSEQMLDAWTAFMREGNPGWPVYEPDHSHTGLFDIEAR